MKKSDIEILICEDDASLGPAMAEALNRAGYQITLVSSGTQALSKLKSGNFLCYIIDCMLPDQNGVDLAKAVRISCRSTPQIIMISGIFKEKGFIERTLKSIESEYYLEKPFNIESLIQTVDDCLKDRISQSVGPLQIFVDQLTNAHSQIIKDDKLHGFEFLLFLAAAVEGQFSGFLTLESKDPEISGKIHFHKGYIFSVESNDQESFFGSLLVKKGFVTKDELEKSLSDPIKKRIGEHLVEINSISPHSIHITMIDQMKIRIGQFIQDTTYSTTLVAENNLPSDVNISPEDFYLLISDWVKTKLSLECLKRHFSDLVNHSIADNQPSIHSESVSSLVSIELEKLSQTEAPFPKLLERVKDCAQQSYPEIYFMILSRQINLELFGTRRPNYDLQIKSLKELLALSDNQNHYETLNLTYSATMEDINNTYFKMVQLLDYKNAPQDSPKELFDLSRKLIRRLDESHRVLSNADLRASYNSSLIDETSPIRKESDLDLGYQALLAGNYKKAFSIFKRMPNTPSSREKWAIYSLWAEIKCHSEPDEAFIKKVSREILKIPVPYDPKRHAHYHIVKGLHNKLLKKYDQAKECFEHAHRVDPSLPVAQRELCRIKDFIKKKKTSESRVTTIISSLLKRKSG